MAPPGGITGKKDAATNQPTPPADKNTSTKRITPTNDDNDIPTNGDDYVYSTPSRKKKKMMKSKKKHARLKWLRQL